MEDTRPEYRGDLTSQTNGTLHYGSPWPNNQYDGGTFTLASGNFYSDWHVFAVEWDDNEIRWFVDDQKFKTETKNPNSLNPASSSETKWPWVEDFYIILNLAVVVRTQEQPTVRRWCLPNLLLKLIMSGCMTCSRQASILFIFFLTRGCG